MSTSLLYHAFGVRRGYKYTRTLYEAGNIIFVIEPKEHSLQCTFCDSTQIIKKGRTWRMIRTVPIGKTPVFIKVAIQRVQCLCCKKIRQVKLPFVRQYRRCSRALERLVLTLSSYMTIQDIAAYFKIGWDLVKDIQKQHFKTKFDKPKLHKLKQIAIDEISISKKKQQRYLTIVYDLLSGLVVFVGDGKGADALDPFWRRVKRAKAEIQAVAIDMSPAYIRAVHENLPKATLVFDHFHIVKLFNEKLSDLRRKLYHQLNEKEDKKLLKGTRWLLLKNPDNLNADRDEPKRLKEALELNEPLAAAYYLKEELRQLWSFATKHEAEVFFDGWLKRAWSTGIKPIITVANTLASRRSGVLDWYDCQISTGPLEGINNKIKTMKRQAYGFRDLEFLKLKIKAIHLSRYALIG
jgi:transposase